MPMACGLGELRLKARASLDCRGVAVTVAGKGDACITLSPSTSSQGCFKLKRGPPESVALPPLESSLDRS
jgi:hypothetical protein